jgi:hypothetical protein
MALQAQQELKDSSEMKGPTGCFVCQLTNEIKSGTVKFSNMGVSRECLELESWLDARRGDSMLVEHSCEH